MAAGAPMPKTGDPQPVPLRVGILFERDASFENWHLQIFDRLLGDSRFELAAFLLAQASGTVTAPFLVDLVSRFDRALFARQPDYKTRRFRTDGDLTPCLTVPSGHEQPSAAALDEWKLDLVLRLAAARLPAAWARTLPFGEWWPSFVDRQAGTTDWAYMREVADRAPSADVEILADTGYGMPARVVASAAFNIKFSAARNTAFVKERTVTLLMRELGRLATTRRIETSQAHARPVMERPPDAALLAAYARRLVTNSTARIARELGHRAGLRTAVWTLYSGEGSIDDFEPGDATEIPPSAASIKADPFFFSHGGERYVFYENYARSDRKAHIAVGRLDRGGITPIGVALASDTHLSFPFVFRDGDDIFMLPETHQARRIEIWRCVDFPLKWQLHATAFEGSSPADNTIFRHQGRWWLLSNMTDYHAFDDHCSELYAFEVDGPKLSRIVPHALNPVVIGSTVARNAGRVFSSKGRLFRPSQNSSYGIYGYGLNIMEILEISHDAYRERLLRTIAPDFKKGLVGCHHFDADGGRYILDARLNA